MSSALGKHYFQGVAGDHLPLADKDIPGLGEAFRLHAQGALAEALAAGEFIDAKSIKNKDLQAIYMADRILLSVKIGLGLPNKIPIETQLNADSRSIVQYARFSFYFWNDHRIAWRALGNLFLQAMLSSYPALMLTVLFLCGHLLSIRGHSFIGFPLAKAMFVLSRHALGERPSVFATHVVFSAFPYTMFVSAKLEQLAETIQSITAKVPPDGYYQNIFQVSALYAHAYSGDIVQTELYSYRFKYLNEHEKSHRYGPLARVMPFLPLALRGYGDLIKEEFLTVLGAHDKTRADILINSQFFRAAGLIALCLDLKEMARDLISESVRYRMLSNSFQSWASIDNRIAAEARSQKPFDPSHDHIVRFPRRAAPPQLGNVLVNAITASPLGIEDPRQFRDEIKRVLEQHFECESTLVADATHINPEIPALRFGDVFLVFEQLAEHRIPTVWAMLNVIAPAIRTLEDSIVRTRDILARLSHTEHLAAIASVTQMMAHDVRKPFSILKIGFGMLESAKDPAGIESVMKIVGPEVERAMGSVEGMIQDVMEIGSSQSEVIGEPINLENLLRRIIADILRINPLHAGSVEVDYDLKHGSLVLGDSAKLERALANIVANAVEAVKASGRIWFHSREKDGFVEICIGNSGSFISPEAIQKVFDPFFTKGKRDGTGLGLAIAQRVVTAHGGKIWCASAKNEEFPQGKVEFWLILPVAP